MRNSLLIVLASLLIISCGAPEVDLKDAKQTVINTGNTPDKFKAKLQQFLKHYITLKDALVEEDLETATKACGPMMAVIRDIDINELTDEKMSDWNLESEMMMFSLEEIARAESIDEKRLNFGDLSESMYAIIKDFGITEGTVYIQYCPMAFDNNGASWVSLDAHILNPYFGDAMLECGKVNEVITFEK